MKDAIKCVAVLLGICVVVSALMAGVNALTAPIISDAREAAQQASLREVLPDAAAFEALDLPEGSAPTVKALYRETEGRGYAVLLETSSQYSNSPMGITAGITPEGIVAGITLTNYQESKDFGKDTYPASYVGKNADLDGVGLVSGVTYSSTAFKNAIGDAFAALIAGGYLSNTDSREAKISACVGETLPGCVSTDGTVAVEPLETLPDGWTDGYIAANRCGYVALLGEGSEVKICLIDAFGSAAAVDLTGEPIDASLTRPDPLYLESNASHADAVKALRAEADTVTPLTAKGLFSTVVGLYAVKSGDKTEYAVFSSPIGADGAVVETLWLLDKEGTVTGMAALTPFPDEPAAPETSVAALLTGQKLSDLTAGALPDGISGDNAKLITRAAADVATAIGRMMIQEVAEP